MKRNLVLILMALMVIGCGGNKRETIADKLQRGKLLAKEAYLKGVDLMHAGDYQDARQWFRVIEAHAPNSSFFSDAKLAIADSYFFDKMATYIEASVEYKSFMTHFPNHERADYAMYQYAMCFFTEIENADRDQTSTLAAYTEFKNLIDKYPSSPYAEKSNEKIDLCLLRLADHEFTVAYYYFRRGVGFEKSAESRLKGIIDNYPGQFDPIKTYFYLAETLWRQEKFTEALSYFKYLKKNHPDSEYQPFVVDRLARWDRISLDGEDPDLYDEEFTHDPLQTYQ